MPRPESNGSAQHKQNVFCERRSFHDFACGSATDAECRSQENNKKHFLHINKQIYDKCTLPADCRNEQSATAYLDLPSTKFLGHSSGRLNENDKQQWLNMCCSFLQFNRMYLIKIERLKNWDSRVWQARTRS